MSGSTPHSNQSEPSRWTDSLFQAFFNQAPFYVGVLSPTGHVMEAGEMALEACGYTRAEVLGQLFWETAWWRNSPEIQARLQAAFAAAQTGVRFQAHLPYVRADGAERWVDFGMSAVFEAGGRLSCVIVTGTDITDRVEAETELATVRKRLESALIAADIGTYQWDVVSDRLYGDQNLAELFGVTLDAAGALPLGEFVAVIHPDDQTRVMAQVRHSVATGENFQEDYRIVHPKGERWVNSRGRMLKDATGRVVNFFGLVMDVTSRKRAENEREAIATRLRRLTAIHETVLSGINDFAYVFDLEGRFLYANRPLLELYGRPLDDVVGKTFSQLGYPAWHAEMHLREIAQVVATKKPFQGEIPFRGESGMSGIFDYIFTPVFGADGRVEAVAGTTRDVTERKRGEVRDRLLVDLDDATRPLIDAPAITHASARLLGEYLGVNRCAYADVEDDENTFNLRGDFNRDVPSIVGRYRFDQFGDECLRLMRAGAPYIVTDAETDPRTAAVREAYRATQIRSVICVPLHKAGRFVAAMAVHQNIARNWLQSDVEALQLVANRCWESIERTRVVRILAESEQRLRLAVATGRLGVWELELATETLTASEGCKSIYGRAATDTFTFAGMLDAVHPEDRVRVRSIIQRSIDQAGEFDLEYRAIWPDGSEHWVLVRGQTTANPDGGPKRMIGVSLDITARKEAEREQVRLREEAVRASRAKDDFLATLSHELRTPLNPVLLLASDAARDSSLPAAARESFAIIRKNVELEARLIDDLLDLTTIVRGKLTIKKEVLDLHVVLADALSAVQPEFDAKAIGFERRFSSAPLAVFGDEVRLVQVFINLLKNAAKFTADGGRVSLSTALENNGMMAVRLVDSGIGMTAQELVRVFQAFEQGDHASEHGVHRFGGLGLGLAIASRLVELHGGRIEAASAGRGKGTTLVVLLPVHQASAPAALPPENKAALAPAKNSRAGLRVLLVEDHESTRQALERLLRRRSYLVTCAASVAEAKACAAAGPFDLVISDVGLPDGDGMELMVHLRDRHGLPGVALTGYGMEEDIARSRAAGFGAHLTKPIRVEALEAVLAEILIAK